MYLVHLVIPVDALQEITSWTWDLQGGVHETPGVQDKHTRTSMNMYFKLRVLYIKC